MFPLNQSWGIQTNIFETNILNLAKNFQLFFDRFFGSSSHVVFFLQLARGVLLKADICKLLEGKGRWPRGVI